MISRRRWRNRLPLPRELNDTVRGYFNFFRSILPTSHHDLAPTSYQSRSPISLSSPSPLVFFLFENVLYLVRFPHSRSDTSLRFHCSTARHASSSTFCINVPLFPSSSFFFFMYVPRKLHVMIHHLCFQRCCDCNEAARLDSLYMGPTPIEVRQWPAQREFRHCLENLPPFALIGALAWTTHAPA